MRITKSVIKDLMIYLIGFGICIGIIFPFFMLLFGVDKSVALSPLFIIACISAGAIVGTVNIIIIKRVLIKRLKEMTVKMNMIKNNVIDVARGKSGEKCNLSECQILIDSDDEVGESIHTYNHLVRTLSLTMSGETLISQLDQSTIVDRALPHILRETNSIAGGIFVEKEGELVCIKDFGIKRIQDLCSNDIIISVANKGDKVHMKYPEDIIVDGILTEIRPKEILVEPLSFNGVRIGVIILASVYEYMNGQIENLGILLKNLSLALHNSEIHEQIQRLAAIDPLTNLFNRRFGMTRLKDEYARSIRTNIPLGIIILDLDNFKKVNDNYGHLGGDKVLVTTAKLIKKNAREGDIVIRYGGEEFLMILPGASLENTYNLAEKIRRNIEDSVISYGDFKIKVTSSFGITSIPEKDYSDEVEVLSAVDEALYLSKENGRNQTTYAK